jgi:hypothetical protein
VTLVKSNTGSPNIIIHNYSTFSLLSAPFGFPLGKGRLVRLIFLVIETFLKIDRFLASPCWTLVCLFDPIWDRRAPPNFASTSRALCPNPLVQQTKLGIASREESKRRKAASNSKPQRGFRDSERFLTSDDDAHQLVRVLRAHRLRVRAGRPQGIAAARRYGAQGAAQSVLFKRKDVQL